MAERTIIKFNCSVCNEQNYTRSRGKKAGSRGEKLQLKKFCPRCRKHTVHKEKK